MLTIIEIKELLKNNEIWLKQAISEGNTEQVFNLNNHRNTLKDMLLVAYESELQKAG